MRNCLNIITTLCLLVSPLTLSAEKLCLRYDQNQKRLISQVKDSCSKKVGVVEVYDTRTFAPSDVINTTSDYSFIAGEVKTFTQTCSSGERAIAGGCSYDNNIGKNLVLLSSQVRDAVSSDTYECTYKNTGVSSLTTPVTVSATCIKIH